MRPRRRGRPFPRRFQQCPRCGASACRVARGASPRPPRSSHGPEARRPLGAATTCSVAPEALQLPRHAVPADTSASGRLGRVGIGQSMRVGRAVPSRYAGRGAARCSWGRCLSRFPQDGTGLICQAPFPANFRIADNTLRTGRSASSVCYGILRNSTLRGWSARPVGVHAVTGGATSAVTQLNSGFAAGRLAAGVAAQLRAAATTV